jgi:hypothetical protein
MTVVRVSRAVVDTRRFERAAAFIRDSQAVLAPAIRQMRGCLHYYAGADPVSNTLINVSVWQTMEDAKQMDALRVMQELAREGTALGIVFERPVCNYETSWEM